MLLALDPRMLISLKDCRELINMVNVFIVVGEAKVIIPLIESDAEVLSKRRKVIHSSSYWFGIKPTLCESHAFICPTSLIKK